MSVWFCASLFLCLFVSMSLCFYVSLFLCLFVSMSLCFYVSLFLCLFVSMYLYLSVSPLYLSIYPKANLTFNMLACWSASPPALSHPPLSFQISNSLLLRLIFGWTNSFIIKMVLVCYLNCWLVSKVFVRTYIVLVHSHQAGVPCHYKQRCGRSRCRWKGWFLGWQLEDVCLSEDAGTKTTLPGTRSNLVWTRWRFRAASKKVFVERACQVFHPGKRDQAS